MGRRHWLVKSEPSTYSIDDLERDGTTEWDGVRNYQARNFMRDEMRPGHRILFYHSNTRPLGIYGIAEVAGEAHPDSSQFDEASPYHDPDSEPDDPRWWCVDVKHVETFPEPVTREAMKATPDLEEMKVLQRGVRLSVMPVEEDEFHAVERMGRSEGSRSQRRKG